MVYKSEWTYLKHDVCLVFIEVMQPGNQTLNLIGLKLHCLISGSLLCWSASVFLSLVVHWVQASSKGLSFRGQWLIWGLSFLWRMPEIQREKQKLVLLVAKSWLSLTFSQWKQTHGQAPLHRDIEAFAMVYPTVIHAEGMEGWKGEQILQSSTCRGWV